MNTEPLIGTPRMTVSAWLYQCARDNDAAARESLMPWNRVKYRGQAWAFRKSAKLVRAAHSRNVNDQTVIESYPDAS